MFRKTTLAAVTLMTLGFGTSAAFADECSGREHTTGTVLGAIAGGVLGGSVSKGNGGAVIGGALLGGLAGNAVSRDLDCNDSPYAARSYQKSFQALWVAAMAGTMAPIAAMSPIPVNTGCAAKSAATSPRSPTAVAVNTRSRARPAVRPIAVTGPSVNLWR